MKTTGRTAGERPQSAADSGPAAERLPARSGVASRLFTHRGALGVVLAVFLLVFPWGRIELSAWSLAAAGSVTVAGVLLRLWAVLQIGGAARRRSRPKAVRIIAWGPFAMVRNPIYIANITVFTGFTILSGLIWAVPLVVGSLGAWYHLLVRREEGFLETAFPREYADYLAETNRWLPSPTFRRRPAEVPAYPLVRALRRERGHLLIVACGFAAVLLVRPLHKSAPRPLGRTAPAAEAVSLDAPQRPTAE